jgi:hypothetical protein
VTRGSAPNWTAAVDSAKNRVLNWAYDLNGNVTDDGLHAYEWDAENRLLSVNGVKSYSYDPENRRVLDGEYWYF